MDFIDFRLLTFKAELMRRNMGWIYRSSRLNSFNIIWELLSFILKLNPVSKTKFENTV